MKKIGVTSENKDTGPASRRTAASLSGLAVLLLFLFAGEALSRIGLPMPGNVLGMLLLTAALGFGLVRRHWIEAAARFLLDHMALFFVPAGVGLMAHGRLLSAHWPILVFSVLFSYLAVLLSSGLVYRLLTKRRSRSRETRRSADGGGNGD
jgi:holin-like protein